MKTGEANFASPVFLIHHPQVRSEAVCDRRVLWLLRRVRDPARAKVLAYTRGIYLAEFQVLYSDN